VPVLVDVDTTLCLSPPLVEAAITSRTRAIMGVHLYSSFADVDALTAISKRRGVALLEDCSQAHGATLRSQRAGSFGIIGAFSLQQSKLLTAGEGGVSVTNDVTLYDRMQQFRADGRRYRRTPPVSRWDFWELEHAGDVAGRNLCLNELSAAAALAGLEHLDEQNALRTKNFQLLREKVRTIDGFRFIETADRCTIPTFYRLCGRIQPSLLRGRAIEDVATALTAELRLPIERIDRSLNEHPLYQPLKHPAVAALGSEAVRFDPSQFSLREAEASSRTCLGMPHQCLLGDESDIDDLVEALRKVLL
jgi:dTDP-4-amino-4,6-dideoxygalactose transaminase